MLLIAFVCNAQEQSLEKITLPSLVNSRQIEEKITFDVTFYDEIGNVCTLQDFKGKVVVVVLFTTWCHNCPEVLRAFNQLEGITGLKIIPLNLGTDSVYALKEHYETHGIKSLNVYQSVDPNIIREIRSVPTCLIFDKNNNFVGGYVGGGYGFYSEDFVIFIRKLVENTGKPEPEILSMLPAKTSY